MDDLISRQAAIDFIDAGRLGDPNELRWSDNDVVNFLKSRPSAQEDLNEWCYDCKEYDRERHCCHRWTKVIRETVEELKQAQQEQQWIPCSEKLPKENSDWKNVTVSDKSGDISFTYSSVGFYLSDGCWIVDNEPMENDSSIRVIAWMPRPEPYKGGTDNDYERAVEQMEHDMVYEPSYNQEDGSM